MRKWNVLLFSLALFFFSRTAAVVQAQQSTGENGRKLVRRVEPRYPEMARRMNLSGTVKIIAVVAADGNVKKVEAVGGSPLLVEAAQNAVIQWKYVAGAESREPVELHFMP